MLVLLKSGHRCEDLSPVRMGDRDPALNPRPVFWAHDRREVLCRGLRRAAMVYHCCGTLPKRTSFGAVEFGWGDAGETHLCVYRPVGKIKMETTDSEMTITVLFRHGSLYQNAFRFTVPKDHWDEAQHILLRMCDEKCYDSCPHAHE